MVTVSLVVGFRVEAMERVVLLEAPFGVVSERRAASEGVGFCGMAGWTPSIASQWPEEGAVSGCSDVAVGGGRCDVNYSPIAKGSTTHR